MKKTVVKSVAFILSLCLAVIIPAVQAENPDDGLFYSFGEYSDALYQVRTPAKSGQSFVSEFKTVTSVSFYLQCDNNNSITIAFYNDPVNDTSPLYSEIFEASDGYSAGWHEFKLNKGVSLDYRQSCTVILSSTAGCVLFGKCGALDNSASGCRSYNYDLPAYGGWVNAGHAVAFEVKGEVYTVADALVSEIEALPDELSMSCEQKVSELIDAYEQLDPENKSKVTNYEKLADALEQIKKLRADITTGINKAISEISSENIRPSDFGAVNAAANELLGLVAEYGEGIKTSVMGLEKLEKAKKDYLALVSSFTCGDVNNDGEITAGDALLSLQCAVGKISLASPAVYAADTDVNEDVSAADALNILQYSVGKVTSFSGEPEKYFYTTVSYDLEKYNATYQSLIGRVMEDGYAQTSLTGAYNGMYVRDSSIQVMAHTANGDFDLARKILTYIFDYHRDYDYGYGLHVLSHNKGPLSNMIQTDNTYFLMNAWCEYMKTAPDSPEKTAFFEDTIEQLQRFADYFYDNGYFSSELMLIRNPHLEHTRDGAFFNAFDTLTNVFASQAYHSLYEILANTEKYAAIAATYRQRADSIAAGINKNLTVEVGGKTVYAEMLSIDKMIASTGQIVKDERLYTGFSFPNIAAGGAAWYAANDEYMRNTLDAYIKYGSAVFHGKYDVLQAASVFTSTESYSSPPNHCIGKCLAWDMMLCCDEGRTDRLIMIMEFCDKYSADMYRETYMPDGGGGDTCNQEQASWLVIAHAYASKYKLPIE